MANVFSYRASHVSRSSSELLQAPLRNAVSSSFEEVVFVNDWIVAGSECERIVTTRAESCFTTSSLMGDFSIPAAHVL